MAIAMYTGARPAACLLLLLLLAVCGARGAQKGASVTLRARWQGTSYMLEAGEFLVRSGGWRGGGWGGRGGAGAARAMAIWLGGLGGPFFSRAPPKLAADLIPIYIG